MAIIPGEVRPDLARTIGVGNRGPRFAAPNLAVQIDAVDDLLVASAAAEMRLENADNFVARRFSRLCAERDCPQGDTGNAKPALDAPTPHERFGDLAAVRFVQSLESRDRSAFGPFGLQRARQHRLAVQQNRAASALGLRLATILGRRHPERVTQDIE